MAASVYYVDYTNGTDTAPGTNTFWGKREPVTSHYHAEAGSDATTTVCATSLVGSADDAYNGSFIWNRTRGLGAYITDYVHTTHTLTHGSIAGNADTDEFYIINAWKTTSKAATTAAAGDIVYIRAGLTETLAAIVDFTNDGTVSSRISLIGTGTGSATLETTDETATEMWHDASTTRPILDSNNGAFYLYSYDDNYWDIINLDAKNSSSSSGSFSIRSSIGDTITNCIFRDATNAVGGNIRMITSPPKDIIFNNCQFINSNAYNVYFYATSAGTLNKITFNSCTFDSGAQGTTHGFYATGNANCNVVVLNNCIFGGNSVHVTNDIYSEGYMLIYASGCVFNTANNITKTTTNMFFSEDHDGVYGAQYIDVYSGIITKDTTVRDGGATSSAKLMPSSVCTVYYPLSVNGINKVECPREYIPDFRVWCPASPTTISIYIRSVTTWGGTYPTAAELWTETEYVTDDTTGAITRATGLSTQVLSDGTTWVAFNCGSITPHVAGWVNIKVKLAKYVASNGIYVDIKPVIT